MQIEKGIGYLIFAASVSLSIFQIWQGLSSTLSATYFRPAHLAWVMVLVFFTVSHDFLPEKPDIFVGSMV